MPKLSNSDWKYYQPFPATRLIFFYSLQRLESFFKLQDSRLLSDHDGEEPRNVEDCIVDKEVDNRQVAHRPLLVLIDFADGLPKTTI